MTKYSVFLAFISFSFGMNASGTCGPETVSWTSPETKKGFDCGAQINSFGGVPIGTKLAVGDPIAGGDATFECTERGWQFVSGTCHAGPKDPLSTGNRCDGLINEFVSKKMRYGSFAKPNAKVIKDVVKTNTKTEYSEASLNKYADRTTYRIPVSKILQRATMDKPIDFDHKIVFQESNPKGQGRFNSPAEAKDFMPQVILFKNGKDLVGLSVAFERPDLKTPEGSPGPVDALAFEIDPFSCKVLRGHFTSAADGSPRSIYSVSAEECSKKRGPGTSLNPRQASLKEVPFGSHLSRL